MFGDDLLQALLFVAQVGLVFVGRSTIFQQKEDLQIGFVRLTILLIVLNGQDRRTNTCKREDDLRFRRMASDRDALLSAR